MLFPDDQIWMIVVGFVIAFVLAFGIGANDVANTFGTSVGSKVLTLRQACILATICEFAGSILLGAKVSSTIREEIVSTAHFAELPDGPKVLMAGQVAALAGSCIWLLLATFFRLPVSGTHSIVGATAGFSLVKFGVKALKVMGLVRIVISWFVSPVLSGMVSVGMFYIIHFLVLTKDEPLEPGLRLLPAFYGTVVLVNTFSVFYSGPKMFHFHRIPLYGIFVLSCTAGSLTALYVKFGLTQYLRGRILAGDEFRISLRIKCLDRFLPKRCRSSSSKAKVAPGSKVTKTDHKLDVLQEEPEDDMSSSGTGGFATNDNSIPTKAEQNLANGGSKVPAGDLPSVTIGFQATNSKLSNCAAVAPGKVKLAFVKSSRVFDVRPSIMEKEESDAEQSDKQVVVAYSRNGSFDRKYSSSLPPIGEEPETHEVKDRPVEVKIFSYLQVATAVFGSFAHGGNDVSNAIGPVIGLWIIGINQSTSSKDVTPLWILVYGGVGIALGLCVWGRRVIQTLGEDLSKVTPSRQVI
ncbi:unnamed protein product [Calicophoron daubneyi]|uniref:Phosphate transporter n=1 Tax=Calicophoron daubneyi TaxID=300641 RepID=A0AAV2TNP8_CALDB